MSIAKNMTARLLDFAVRKAGAPARSLARRIVPLPLKRKLSRLLTKEIDTKDQYTDTKDGHRFVTLKEPVFLQVRYEGVYEKDLSELSRKLVGEGDTVVDIGANFGWYSILMAAAVGEKGKVYAYEPNESIFSVLSRNIELNNYKDRIHLTRCGIGETEETAVLMADTAESAIGYFDKGKDKKAGGEAVGSIEIHRLDDLLADKAGEISFIKIDVEGFEPFVLRGAPKILGSENPPAILMEFNIEALERQDIDVDAFIQELEDMDTHIVKTDKGRLVELDAIPRQNENLFFIPRKGKFSREIESLR